MVSKVLSAPTINQVFPQGTVDPGFVYTVTGFLLNGDAFALSQAAGTFDLKPGNYIGVVSKLGSNSMPSANLVIADDTTVTLQVPDPNQPATFS